MLTISAPAKINLFLHITGRRANGYHELQSLVVFADAGDVLHAMPADALTLEVTGPFAGALAAEQDNLVLRAARALGQGRTAALTLEKKLPVGAGLGGGSSDAAAALKLLARLWQWPEASLYSLGLALGSDVPACVYGKPCWMEGAGERITPAALKFPLPMVLANPGAPLSTAEVFSRVNRPYNNTIPLPEQFDGRDSLMKFLSGTRNDLEAPAIAALPIIGKVLAALRECEGSLLSCMSGSGATCFGIFHNEEAANAAAVRLSRAQPGWWVRSVSSLASDEGEALVLPAPSAKLA